MSWPLRPGDRVLVVAPSSPVDPGRLEVGLAVLTSWGLVVERGNSLTSVVGHGHRHLAGSDAVRASDVLRGLLDPGIAAVVCARGGSGCTRLLPILARELIRRPPTNTVLVGASDVTALHALLQADASVVNLFGPMIATHVLAGLDPDPLTVDALRAGLMGAELPRLQGQGLTGGVSTGVLVGGTLSLLTALLGTPFQLRVPAGAVLALEDVGEPGYRLDRMLASLSQAGVLDALGGVAAGSFEGCGPPHSVAALISEWFGPLGVPVVTGLSFGHGRPQRLLRLGAQVLLDAGEGTLTHVD